MNKSHYAFGISNANTVKIEHILKETMLYFKIDKEPSNRFLIPYSTLPHSWF